MDSFRVVLFECSTHSRRWSACTANYKEYLPASPPASSAAHDPTTIYDRHLCRYECTIAAPWLNRRNSVYERHSGSELFHREHRLNLRPELSVSSKPVPVAVRFTGGRTMQGQNAGSTAANRRHEMVFSHQRLFPCHLIDWQVCGCERFNIRQQIVSPDLNL